MGQMRSLIAGVILIYSFISHGAELSGPITSNTFWDKSGNPYRVTNDIAVANDVTLTIGPGVEVVISMDISLRGSGTIDIAGSADQRVIVRGETPTNLWRAITVTGTNANLNIRFADISGGSVQFGSGSTGVIEDSFIHDFNNGSTPIAHATAARGVTVRRAHFQNYYETLWQETMMLIEDSLFEYASRTNSDALDFDTAPPGSTIRRCTFRHGSRQNTDAIDLGSGSRGVVVEDCLIYDFPSDKGISIGENSFEIVVRNTVIQGCNSGIAVKDSCTATLNGCTIVANDFGIRNYNKADPLALTGGGHITESSNNLLWGNQLTVSLSNGSTFVADHSLISATNWPGLGNINLEPSFVDLAASDLRLKSDSPGISAGRDGVQIGGHFPLGATIAGSHPVLIREGRRSDEFSISLWVDTEKSYSVMVSGSPSGGWTELANIVTETGPELRALKFPVMPGANFFRVRATSRSGL